MKLSSVLILVILFISANNYYTQNLFDAIADENIESVKAIIYNNLPQINTANERGEYPLLKAVEKGSYEITSLLLNNGADVNAKTRFNTAAIHFAAFFNNHKIIRLLADHGTDINIQNNNGFTPIFYAVIKGKFETVKLLIELGADCRVKDFTGQSLLHKAAIINHPAMIKFFIGKKLDFEEANNNNKTPLFCAVENGMVEVVGNYIKSNNIDYNIVTKDGSTYLHAAARGGMTDFAKELIDKGADVNIVNVYNYAPIDIARNENHNTFVELLSTKGARLTKDKFKPGKGKYLGQTEPGIKPVMFAPGLISTPELNERDVTFSHDNNEFYFTRWPVNRVWNIMTMHRTAGGWSDPAPVSFMKPYHHAEACFTPDDNQLFFISNRPANGEGPAENWEIWFTDKTPNGWSEPELLGDEFKGGFYPTFTNDNKMYFTNAASDIAYARYVNGNYTGIEVLDDSVNTSADEYNSCIVPDESCLIFSSTGYDDQLGHGDLYICFRKTDGTWTKAKNMGPAINSDTHDYCPAISPDGKYFFFASKKYGTEDIFWVSTKIFDELKK